MVRLPDLEDLAALPDLKDLTLHRRATFLLELRAAGDRTATGDVGKDWNRPETGIRPRPEAPESYYYVRVIQAFSQAQLVREGEIAWSSPIFVRRKKP